MVFRNIGYFLLENGSYFSICSKEFAVDLVPFENYNKLVARMLFFGRIVR